MNNCIKALLIALALAFSGTASATRNGSGTYTLPAGNPVNTGTPINSAWANNTLSDIAQAISASIAKDGQTVPTANLPMGGFKHTNVANATARNSYPAAGQVQDFSLQTLSAVAGTNTITGSLTPAITAYSAGMLVVFQPANSSSGAVTLAINGLSALDVQKNDGDALVSGDLVAGIPALLMLDTGADDWILLNPQSATLSNGVSLTDLARLSQVNTFTAATQEIENAAPTLLIDETDAPANERSWLVRSSGGILAVSTATDAAPTTAVSNAITCDRTGTTVDSCNIAATAVTANGSAVVTAASNITSGTYTPTSSSLVNLDSLTPALTQWSRIGSIVTVSGSVAADPTVAANTTTQFEITLPVASPGLSSSSQLNGVAIWSPDQSGVTVRVVGNGTTHLAAFRFQSPSTSANTIWFTFQYQVL